MRSARSRRGRCVFVRCVNGPALPAAWDGGATGGCAEGWEHASPHDRCSNRAWRLPVLPSWLQDVQDERGRTEAEFFQYVSQVRPSFPPAPRASICVALLRRAERPCAWRTYLPALQPHAACWCRSSPGLSPAASTCPITLQVYRFFMTGDDAKCEEVDGRQVRPAVHAPWVAFGEERRSGAGPSDPALGQGAAVDHCQRPCLPANPSHPSAGRRLSLRRGPPASAATSSGWRRCAQLVWDGRCCLGCCA